MPKLRTADVTALGILAATGTVYAAVTLHVGLHTPPRPRKDRT